MLEIGCALVVKESRVKKMNYLFHTAIVNMYSQSSIWKFQLGMVRRQRKNKFDKEPNMKHWRKTFPSKNIKCRHMPYSHPCLGLISNLMLTGRSLLIL